MVVKRELNEIIHIKTSSSVPGKQEILDNCISFHCFTVGESRLTEDKLDLPVLTPGFTYCRC